MNTQDIRQDEAQAEIVETTETTLQIQTGVQAGFMGMNPLDLVKDNAIRAWDTAKSWF